MQDDANELARRSFLAGGLGGLAGALLGGGLGAWLFRERPLNARPPIIIKVSSLALWRAQDLRQQGSKPEYWVPDDASPLGINVLWPFSTFPDEEYRDIQSVVMETANGKVLSIELDRNNARVVYKSDKNLKKEGLRFRHPDDPTIKKLLGTDLNGNVAFDYHDGDLKFLMLVR